MPSAPAQFKNDAARGDEYNNSPCKEGRPKLLKDKIHRPTTPSGIFSKIPPPPRANHAFNHLPPTLPLYYEGKVMKTIFPQNYVYVLRTTTTRHMVSSIDFLFPFSREFSDLNFASYVLYNLPVLCHVSRTESLGYLWLYLNGEAGQLVTLKFKPLNLVIT